MAKINNPWVNYVTRSFSDIKSSVLNRVKTQCPEITDLSDSNILVIIISIFAGIAEMLNYYIDNMARESYIGSARRLSSILKIVRLINYKVKSSIAASSDLTLSLVGEDGNPVETQSQITIPLETVFSTASGLVFISTESATIEIGETGTTVKVKQHTLASLQLIGTGNGTAFQSIYLPSDYEHGSCVITIDSVTWTYRDFLDVSGPTDKHYTTEVDDYGLAYIKFGDGVNGLKPDTGLSIYLTYYRTSGASGNSNIDTITSIDSNIAIPNQTPVISEILATNHIAASGGRDTEGLEVIRKLAPLSLRTLNRAVTRQDYIDIAKLAPGVDKASLYFECGKKVEVYIAPMGGGVASIQLCNDTNDFIDEKKMVTTFVSVLPTGETYIGMSISVTGKFRVPSILIEQDIITELTQAYSYVNSDINKPVRTSDIIALVDNLEKIDFLELTEIYQIPYARPKVQTLQELVWERKVMTGSTDTHEWRLVFQEEPVYGDSYFRVYRDKVWKKNLAFGDWYDPAPTSFTELNFLILAADNAGLENGDTWLFKTYPYNKDLVLTDFTVPIIRSQDIILTITEQNYIV